MITPLIVSPAVSAAVSRPTGAFGIAPAAVPASTATSSTKPALKLPTKDPAGIKDLGPRRVPASQIGVTTPQPPSLHLPTLNMTPEASVSYQRNKMLSEDSLEMQQARINAREYGVAAGQIHSSQQEGAAQRAMSDAVAPLAEAEATLAAGETISNWQQKTDEIMTTYESLYTERLADLGYDSQMSQLMATLNTDLNRTLINSYTSLMNNTDIDLGQGATDRLTTIINSAQDNNNLALGMNFRY